ncbi:MAG TPA: hypothetical protein PK629_11400 [Oscillospiraceae bacterium]|nr:hypothetical protein [Oscillospiraceae bacterium]HPF55829.1 hypothetical protein [Clostridiales bacterium]HPK35117.1 hypothetical protein [Oscillospiraceae bacterium]HPR75268.1 hypothetical protein [Oscillospiraceae bacterium]
MKRLFGILTALFLIATSFTLTTSATGGSSLSISGPSTLAPGETGTFTVSATLDDVAAIQATLNYDTGFFEYVSYADKDGDVTISDNNSTGTLQFEWDVTANASETIVLFTVNLTCKNGTSINTTGALSLSNIVAGRLTGAIPPSEAVSCTGGSLTVTCLEAITGVAITEIDTPVAGSTPDASAAVAATGVSATAAVTWTETASGNAVSGNFVYGVNYTATVVLTAGSSYKFVSGTTATVNTYEATSVIPSSDGSTLTVTYAFTSTGAEPISSVAVTGVVEPVAGNAPSTAGTTATTGATVSSVSWSPSVSTFVYGTSYTVTVVLNAASGYEFASSMTSIKINGNDATITANSGSSLTLTYQFTATAAVVSSVEVTGVVEPVAGNAPSTAGTTATTGATVSGVSWSPSASTFVYGTSYTVTVVLTAASGYKFTSSTTATVNTYAATSVTASGDGSTLTVTYTFASTGAEPIASVAISDITAPVADAIPDNSAAVTATGVSASAEVSWSPTDSPFAYNEAYTASVTLTADSGYKFTSSTTATVNTYGATSVTLNSNGTLTVTYEFGATGMEPPSITGNPQGVTVLAGGTIQPLSVTASANKGTLSYQWYSNSTDSNTNGVLITGAILSSYSPPTDTIGTTYYYCVVTNSDNAGLGSASATSASATAAVVVKRTSIETSVYTIDAANDVLKMVSLGTTADELKGKLLNDTADIKIFGGDTECTGSGVVATGMTVKYYVNGVIVDTLTISVLGDVSGDGIGDIDDILYQRAQIVGTYTMSVCELAAADINGDSVIDITDILYIRAHILGTYTITAQ